VERAPPLLQALSAPDGTSLGTFTLEGYPAVNENGESFLDDGAQIHFTIRDANNAITMEVAAAGAAVATSPVHALCMRGAILASRRGAQWSGRGLASPAYSAMEGQTNIALGCPRHFLPADNEAAC
jgi:hypothetical protein